jgi:S-DNA-T family DNA segregation ATPase FtsK/SpoIIIE
MITHRSWSPLHDRQRSQGHCVRPQVGRASGAARLALASGGVITRPHGQRTPASPATRGSGCTVVISRPPRRPAPPLPAGELALEPPPAIPQATGARWQQWLAVLPMLAGTVATAMMFGGRDGAGAYTYVVGGIFGLSTLGMLVLNFGNTGGPRKAELMQARRDYLRYLSNARRQVRVAIAEQREGLAYRHPEPAALWSEAIGPRVWERRAADADFAVVRVGVGPQSLATALIAPVIDPNADLEPVTAGALRRFLDAYAVVPDLPISLALRSFSRVGLRGPETSARGLARAIVCQLTTFHAPDEVVIAACVAPDRRRDWDWLKWLPHALHPTESDRIGPRRLVATSLAELDQLLADMVGNRGRFSPPTPGRAIDAVTPHVVLLADGGDTTNSAHLGVSGGLAGVTVIEMGGPHTANGGPPSTERSTLALVIGVDGELHSATVDGRAEVGHADTMSHDDAEALARRLAHLRLSASTTERPAIGADQDLVELLGIDVSNAPLASLWAPRSPRELLRIPVGTGAKGERVDLDIKEAAQDGMGPHGLIVGTTGSGKSELLRTLVLGLAVTHSSEALNVVLVDFKGGATFATLDRLPHTSAVITNLADELPLVDRMNDALAGELNRRQELLRRAGNFASLRDYDRARANGAPLPPLPALLVVCDEFTELLTAKPDFINLFVQIGRVGRSLGVHLILATQRLEEGRLRGLESNLSYRIALRTSTTGESRQVIGEPDAATLPSTPGHGFLRVGPDDLRRFKAAYVSGPYVPRRPADRAAAGLAIEPYSTEHAPAPPSAPVHATPESSITLMEVVVQRLADQGPPAHAVWLPPLETPSTLDELLGGGVVRDQGRGLATGQSQLWGNLRVPIALADRPFEQRRDVSWLDLAGATGHVGFVGGPQSGKSTAVRSLVTGLALTHTPREVQVYCLDFGGGSLSALRQLPHVGSIAGRLDTALVRRTVGEVATLLSDRERRFTARGIDSMASFRTMRRSADLDATVAVPEDGFGDVFLVIDGWSTLRGEYEDLEPVLVDIATRGLSYGIHLVVTATRWHDLRAARDLLGSRVELRLGDPGDSAVNRRSAENVPQTTPGRGLAADGTHILTALPRTRELAPADLVSAIGSDWSGPSAPPVRMLPSVLPYSALLGTGEEIDRVPLGTGLELPLGIAEADLRPVLLDFASEPHLVAFGDSECGKSMLLRSLAESIIRRYSPEQARIVLIDYRRSLLGAIETDHLIGYGTAADNAVSLLDAVAAKLDKRRPGPDVTPQQLRERSFWKGPECFVLVDDYDLVNSGHANPLLPLLEYLPQARDVGLHLIITRRAGGAGRGLFEPIMQRLRELGTPGLVMAGDRDEGPLVGNVRPGPQPAGRGWLVTRKYGARLIQLAKLDS